MSDFPPEQAVAVAVPVEVSATAELHPGLGVALGVKFHQLDPVAGDEGREGDEMLLGHGVVDGQKMLVLHILDGDGMVFVGFLGLQGKLV